MCIGILHGLTTGVGYMFIGVGEFLQRFLRVLQATLKKP